MEDNKDIKQLLVVAIAIVTMFGMAVASMVYANNKNRDFEYKMAAEGYEQSTVPGVTGVSWVKIRGERP